MTPEELWASLAPQAEAIEQELIIRDDLKAAFMDMVETGTGIYRSGMFNVDIHNNDVGMVFIDETDPLISAALQKAIEAVRRAESSGPKVIFIGRADQLPPIGNMNVIEGLSDIVMQSMIKSIEVCADDCWMYELPERNWSVPKKPNKPKYQVPQQSFRARMRSVNRNR